ncbi:MAG: cation:proton antiporter [Thermoplasmata archaeon]|nr:cation:proton antiporter [Thermoplasmata archaeon]
MALILAKLFGLAMDKMNQPSVIGEIVAGIVLGSIAAALPATIHIWHFNLDALILDFDPITNKAFFDMAQIGVLLLLFTSGMHISIRSIKRTGKVSALTAIGGVVFPFTLGVLLGSVVWNKYPDDMLMASMATGAIFTATSVGVTARTMMDLDLMRTDVAVTILTTAVIDDVIAIILLTVVLAGAGATGMPVGVLILGIGVFFLLYLIVGLKHSKRIMGFGERLGSPKVMVTIALFFCFLLSALAEIVSLAAITGAFLAGLMVSSSKSSRFISEDVNTLARMFFIPLFFVSIGTQVRLGSIFEFDDIYDLALFMLIPMAIVGKIIGCGLGAVIGGFDTRDAMRVGVGMIPKMEIALVVVTTAISLGVFNFRPGLGEKMLAITILHVMVTAFITPVLIKRLFRDVDHERPMPDW